MEQGHLLDTIDFSEVIAADPDLAQYINSQTEATKKQITLKGYVSPQPLFEPRWSNRVVVGNLPEVTSQKSEMLRRVIAKVFSKACECNLDADQVCMPMHNEKNLRCTFITFPDEELAKTAIAKCNGFPFDKLHNLVVVSFDDFDRILETPSEYAQPVVYSQSQLKSWLLDTRSRDQFVIRYGSSTEVYWNDPIAEKSELVSRGPGDRVWTDKYVKWSSQGTYLATLHHQGVILWAGEEFAEINRFSQLSVTDVEFSPCERYLLTYSQKPNSTAIFTVWNVFTGEELRSFQTAEAGKFKWSHNGDFVAKQGQDLISIYQTVDMAMIEDGAGNRTSVNIPHLVNFEWSPGAALLAYHSKEHQSSPAQIKIIRIPTREVVASKAIFEVYNCALFWQKNNEYMAAVIHARHKSKDKPKSSSIEIFLMMQKNIPVESLKLGVLVLNFAWEPHNNRFAIIKQVEDKKKMLSVYQIDGTNCLQIGEIETPGSEILWAPQGGHLIVIVKTGRNVEGKVEFYSVQATGIFFLNTGTHMNLSHIEWDPSGRYFITAATQPVSPTPVMLLGSGYTMWTCHGLQLYYMNQDNFYQILWRPRPKAMLPKDVEAQIEKELAVKAKKYEEEDTSVRNQYKNKQREDEKRMWQRFSNILDNNRKLWKETADKRASVQGFTDTQEAARWFTKQVKVEKLLHIEYRRE
jgi:translation initiation factor 3 subunit B